MLDPNICMYLCEDTKTWFISDYEYFYSPVQASISFFSMFDIGFFAEFELTPTIEEATCERNIAK